MALKYQYNPNATNLESDVTSELAEKVIDGCILFLGESAIDSRAPYNPNPLYLNSDSTELTQQLEYIDSDVNGVGNNGPAYVLQGQTQQEEVAVSRPIVVTQLIDGIPAQIGYGYSRFDGTFTVSLFTESDAPVIATSWQAYGDIWQAESSVSNGDVIRPTEANGFVYQVINSGVLGAVEPNWTAIKDEQVTNGSVTLKAVVYYQPVAHAPIDIQKNYAGGAWPAEILAYNQCPVFDPDSFELSPEVRAMFP